MAAGESTQLSGVSLLDDGLLPSHSLDITDEDLFKFVDPLAAMQPSHAALMDDPAAWQTELSHITVPAVDLKV